jgi:hypothetical protein
VRLDKYKPNRRGIREVLSSAGVRADLVARALRIAEAAQASYEARPPHQGHVEVVVDSQGDAERTVRARAAVIALHPAAQHIEADRRPLGAAVDAAG